MKNLYMFFFFLLMSCESYLYDDYKIIDYKGQVDSDHTQKDNLYKVKKGKGTTTLPKKKIIIIRRTK